MKQIKVRATFTEMVLGTASNNKDIHGDYIASKAPDAKSKEEEIAAIGVEEYAEKQMTVFPKLEDGTPFIWDYQIKGFFMIDGVIFVEERKIPIDMHGGEMGVLERPLRAQTAQGERIALASSETVPAGSTIEFTITCLSDQYAPAVKEWLDYGKYRGLLQWRNAGYGRYLYEILDNDGNVIGGNMK